ncbi:MAG: molybdopterin cofactor-binding domain-containing protein [Pirellulales bacterium]
MTSDQLLDPILEAEILEDEDQIDRVAFDFHLSRRQMVQLLGAGLLIAVAAPSTSAQQPRGRGGRGRGGRGGRGGSPTPLAARLHLAKDGAITLLTGKVECGQGARAQLAQAAAEELRLPVERITVILADTGLTPNDGTTAGSRTTPSTVPAVRQACAAARELLVQLAAQQWETQPGEVEVRDGKVIHAASRREQSYGDLASAEGAAGEFQKTVPANVTLTPLREWKVLGKSAPRPNGRDLVTGRHAYPSDVVREGMLYGKILRPPAYGSELLSIDLTPAKSMTDVEAVRDGQFVGVVAKTSFAAEQALGAIAKTAEWDDAPAQPSSDNLYDHLKKTARGGVPENPFASDVASAAKSLRQTYTVAYAQHAPLEPRAAVSEWEGDKLTVWTATQNPFRVRSEIAQAFRIPEDRVRVIVPDFGGGFGGKHTGETAVEAARLAQAAKRPVSLQWTREEEFTWAYFRPAAVIEVEASLDGKGAITSWHFININSGGSAIDTPYRIAKARSQFLQADAPLRHGSYRALASTANTFARECAMDELAQAAGRDPLEFRLAHLESGRLRAVLEEAAVKFDWPARVKAKAPNVGVGLACGTEKGSYTAACALVAIDPDTNRIRVQKVTQAYECGAILNPDNLRAQVEGCILMGLGPALREEMRFENGKIQNAAFARYSVPRFNDVPELDIHLLNRTDLPSVGAGETPIIAIAPAIANAVFHATGRRIRQMPIRLPAPA